MSFTLKKEDLRQYSIAGILFLLLLIPNFFTLFYSTDIRGNLKMSAAYLVLCIAIWALVGAIAGIRNMFRIGLVFFLFAPVEIGFLKSVGMPVNRGLMEALLHTDFHEAREQIISNIPALILMLLLAGVYIFFLSRLKNLHIPKKIRLLTIGLFALLNIILYWQMYRSLDGMDINDQPESALEITLKKYQKIYPVNILVNGSIVYAEERRNQKLMKKLSRFRFESKQNPAEHSPEVYVLVIGETARYASFHINGYARETSPNLEKIPNLVSFTNMYTSANLTELSVPQLITRATPQNFDLQYKEKTILDAFSEAGFFTAWISDQSSKNAVVNRLKSTAGYCYFSKTDFDSDHNYDGYLLKNLDKVLRSPASKKFIVIHTLGSHFRYSNRYPASFEKFRPNIGKTGYDQLTADNKEEIVNSYDNSVLYTDWFLSQVVSRIRKTGSASAMLYLSDHGDNLFDDSRQLMGHGTANPTKYEYHIPCFVWLSDLYMKNHPQQTRALEENRNKRASSTSTFYTLLDMANIRYRNSAAEISKSLANPAYKAPEQRVMLNSDKKIILLPD